MTTIRPQHQDAFNAYNAHINRLQEKFQLPTMYLHQAIGWQQTLSEMSLLEGVKELYYSFDCQSIGAARELYRQIMSK